MFKKYIRREWITAGRFQEAAAAIKARLSKQGVRYAELTFDAALANQMGLDPNDAARAIKAGAGERFEVRVFAGVSRSPNLFDRLPRILSLADAEHIDGIDLMGDETLIDVRKFRKLFLAARRNGKATKAHAGETAGAEQVERTIDDLEVTRIEHGVRAVEDPKLVERLAREKITLDLCPTSNIKLGVVRDWASHPAGRLHRTGVPITISTDDPWIFGTTLTGELEAAQAAFNWSERDMAAIRQNTIDASKLTV